MRAAALFLLLAGLALAGRALWPASAESGAAAFVLGPLLLVASLCVGRMCSHLGLPHLTGFLLGGAVWGPSLAGLVGTPALHALAPAKSVALVLIGLLAGCRLRFAVLRPRLAGVCAFSVITLLATGSLLFGLLLTVAGRLDLGPALTFGQRCTVALVFAIVTSALSPAVVTGVIAESRAHGPLSELTLSVVMLTDLLIVVGFSLAEEALGLLGASGGQLSAAWHIGASGLVGAALGAALCPLSSSGRRSGGALVLASVTATALLGRWLGLEPLLVGLAAGLVLENRPVALGARVLLGTAWLSLPVLALFFAVVGAEVDVHVFAQGFAYAMLAALVRAVGIQLGTMAARPLANVDPTSARLLPLGMVPQAGVAIALATLVRASAVPWGAPLATLILGVIVCNELVGPILFRLALARAGELGPPLAAEAHRVSAELRRE